MTSDLCEPPEDFYPPLPTAKLKCECGEISDMTIRQTSIGNGGDSHDEWEAICPKCHAKQDLMGNEVLCDNCGLVVAPNEINNVDDDWLCSTCKARIQDMNR